MVKNFKMVCRPVIAMPSESFDSEGIGYSPNIVTHVIAN